MLSPEEQTPPSADPKTAEPELDLGLVASGNAEVDDAVNVLANLDEVDVTGHPDIFESVHEKLAASLASFDEPSTEVDASTTG